MADIHPPVEGNGPLWMQILMRAIGVTLEGVKTSTDAVTWALKESAIRPPEDYADFSRWTQWGFDVKSPEYGCVIVMPNFVGMFQRQEGPDIYLVGVHGEGSPVSVAAYDEEALVACRWPAGEDFLSGYYPRDERAPPE